MTTKRFEIAFEGEPFEGGAIDVRDLAPTLLAFGSVIQAANKALNGDRAEASLKVAAADHGSFIAQLIVDVSWFADMLDVVAANPDRAVAADQLMSILLKAGTGLAGATVGLLQVIKFLRGRKPDALEPGAHFGHTAITLNRTTLIVDAPTLALLKDIPTREAIENFGRKAAHVKGLENLSIGDPENKSETVEIERKDLPSLDVPEDDAPPEPEVSHRETWLKIISNHFREGYKWRFSDGSDRTFTAVMEDTNFQNRAQEGHQAFTANDAIKCRLREEQTLFSNSLSKEVFVEEVLDFRAGPRQLHLI